MKVTTVRFGADLWRFLEAEADRAGVSVSQYIREAALARASAAAAARGEDPLTLFAGAPPSRASQARTHKTEGLISDTAALAAQTEQALRHAQAVTAQSEEAIGRTNARRAKTRNRP